jgi:hypothetical protein
VLHGLVETRRFDFGDRRWAWLARYREEIWTVLKLAEVGASLFVIEVIVYERVQL